MMSVFPASPESELSLQRDVQLQVSSDKWLEMFGLKNLKLTLQQVLPRIGFRRVDNYVKSLNKQVSSKYATGLFRQVELNDGSVYNLTAPPEKLHQLEHELHQCLGLYKKRLEWLNSGSRSVFGVVEESNIVLVIHVDTMDVSEFTLFMLEVWKVIKEQFSNIERFNLIRVADDPVLWKNNPIRVNPDTLEDALNWVSATRPVTTNSPTGIVEAVMAAFGQIKVDAVYLYTGGSCSERSQHILRRKVMDYRKPLNIIVGEAHNTALLELMQETAELTGGRFRQFSLKGRELTPNQSISRNHTGEECLPPTDVERNITRVWAELDEVKIVLSQVQALLLNYGQGSELSDAVGMLGDQEMENDPDTKNVSADYQDSTSWLMEHGLEAYGADFFSFLSDKVFKHSAGVSSIPPSEFSSQKGIILKPSQVDAKYCNNFAHIRWNDGTIKHVHITETHLKEFRGKVSEVTQGVKDRLGKLLTSSRAVFGNIVGSQVVVVFDTSSSVAQRFSAFKEKLKGLIREQLSYVHSFNLVSFGTHVIPWKEGLVKTSVMTVEEACTWTDTLSAGGSTNTLDALQAACSYQDADSIYLCSDGRPNQNADLILGLLRNMTRVPISTVAFNCLDEEANHFLLQVAQVNGGGYTKSVFEEDHSVTYTENVDIELLRQELERAAAEVTLMEELATECSRLAWDSRPKQPRSQTSPEAPSLVPKPPDSRPSTARSYPHRRHQSILPASYKNIVIHTSNNDSSAYEGRNSEHLSRGHGPKTQDQTRSARDEFLGWVQDHSLAARRLTILDALSATLVHQTSKFVPVLGKQVSSKVFQQEFPVVRVSNDSAHDFLVLNPQSVDLLSYEVKLQSAIYEDLEFLNKTVFSLLSDDVKSRFPSDRIPDYIENKELFLQDLKDNNGPLSEDDIGVLLAEVDQARSFLRQSQELREKTAQLSQRRSMSDLKASPPFSEVRTVATKLLKPQQQRLHPNSASQAQANIHPMRNSRVIARLDLDGLYHPGRVVDCPQRDYIVVRFDDGAEQQLTHLRYIIEIGGALPCPPLAVGDCVLAASVYPGDMNPTGCIVYVPAIVRVLPDNLPTTPMLYTVLKYGGTKVDLTRGDLVRVSRARFLDTCYYIKDLKKTVSRRGSVGNLPQRQKQPSNAFNSDAGDPVEHYSKVEMMEVVTPFAAASPSLTAVTSLSGHAKSDTYAKGVTKIAPPAPQNPLLLAWLTQVKAATSAPVPKPDFLPGIDEHPAHGSVTPVRRHRHCERHRRRSAGPVPPRSHGAQSPCLAVDSELRRDSSSDTPTFHQENRQVDNHDVRLDIERLSESLINVVGPMEEKVKSLSLAVEAMSKALPDQKASYDRVLVEIGRLSAGTGTTSSRNIVDEDIVAKLLESQLEYFSRQMEFLRQQQQQVWRKTEPILSASLPQDAIQDSVASPNLDMVKQEANVTQDAPVAPGTFEEVPVEDVVIASADNLLNMEMPDLFDQPPDQESSRLSPTEPTMIKPVTNRAPEQPEDGHLPHQQEESPSQREVLARWTDDGWFYECTIVEELQGDVVVKDSLGNTCTVNKLYVLPLGQDPSCSSRTISVGSPVVACFPGYSFAYAPGIITSMGPPEKIMIIFYDGTESSVPPSEIFPASRDLVGSASSYILDKENQLIGLEVIARNDADGVFRQAVVKDRCPGHRQFLVEWSDKTLEPKSLSLILSRMLCPARSLQVGDCIIGKSEADQVFLPGSVLDSSVGDGIAIRLCNSEIRINVIPDEVFWISRDYYDAQLACWMYSRRETRSLSSSLGS